MDCMIVGGEVVVKRSIARRDRGLKGGRRSRRSPSDVIKNDSSRRCLQLASPGIAGERAVDKGGGCLVQGNKKEG